MFSRSAGSAIGAAVFGAIANSTLAARLAHPPAAVSAALGGRGVDAASLVLGGKLPTGDSVVATFVRDALYGASHHVFVGLVVVALLGGAAILLMPHRTEELVFDRS
jgi:hypothetical protein